MLMTFFMVFLIGDSGLWSPKTYTCIWLREYYAVVFTSILTATLTDTIFIFLIIRIHCALFDHGHLNPAHVFVMVLP